MEILSVWLIHHKASIDPDSPMNYDGSEYMLGVGVVPATSMKEALDLFDKYLSDQKMQVLELWKCEQYSPENFVDATQNNKTLQDNKEINEVASQALENGTIFYACGVSSEALDCMEEDEK